jgi:hypothetical protein
MAKLLRSSETAGCGATIELDNGEVVYVSIAQTGVLVRKWDMNGGLIKSLLSNFFGPTLYNESSVYKNAQTARALSLIYPEQASPLSFKNPVLAAFSNAIWHCSSAAEVCTVLNEAVAKFSDAERVVDAVPASGDFKNSDGKIVSDLADLMAAGELKPDAFYDISVLPHPKEDILLAIEREILREPLDARAEWLAVGAAFLPSFQQGIGLKPLFWIGADLAGLERSTPDVKEQRRVLAHSPDRARADRYFALMKIESDQIQTRIDAAMRLRRARMARPPLSTTPSSPTPPPSVQTSPAPVTSRSRAAAPPSRRQDIFDSAGNALIGPDELLPVIARYITEAKRILDITKEEAIRRSEHGDGGKFSMEPLVRCLKDAQTHPRASYYAKFALDEDGDISSIHHGWCFDSFANLDGQEVNLLQALRFADTRDGILSAFFASVILPTIGAYWHGLYERDYQLIESPHELNEAVFSDDLKRAIGDTRTVLKTPLGLRIRRVDGNKSCKCLCLSETEGLLDIEFMISADGRASEPVRIVLREPEGRTLY